MQFCDVLKMLRVEHSMTQEQLAAHLNITRSTIAGYETKRKEPDFDRLTQIAHIFGVSTDFLLGIDENLKDSNHKTFICFRNRGQKETITPVPDEYVDRLHNLLRAGLPELFATQMKNRPSR